MSILTFFDDNNDKERFLKAFASLENNVDFVSVIDTMRLYMSYLDKTIRHTVDDVQLRRLQGEAIAIDDILQVFDIAHNR